MFMFPTATHVESSYKAGGERITANTVVNTKYEFNSLDISDSFLTVEPDDAQPMAYHRLEWTRDEHQPLPTSPRDPHRRLFAGVIENVLSPSECAQLIRLAEASPAQTDSGAEPWGQALVSVGPGQEVLMTHYRRSKRIIWDNSEIVRRIWERCRTRTEMVADMNKAVDEYLAPQEDDAADDDEDPSQEKKKPRWSLVGLNRRMRFLKYDKGDFFAPHNDGPYREIADNGRVHLTYFTIHLYLNNSQEALSEIATATGQSIADVARLMDPPALGAKDQRRLHGGSTAFLDRNRMPKDEVHCRAGRVLVFQHRWMYHCGSHVTAGTKYTMRCDVLYEKESRAVSERVRTEGGDGEREVADEGDEKDGEDKHKSDARP